MSTLCGYDVVMEYSRLAIARQVESSLASSEGGAFPFEMEAAIPAPPLPDGLAHFIFHGITLTLQPGTNRTDLAIAFHNSSVLWSSAEVGGLSGKVVLKNAPLVLARLGAGRMAIRVDAAVATFELQLDSASRTKLEALRRAAGISASLNTLVASMAAPLRVRIQALVAAAVFPKAGVATVGSGSDGGISPLAFRQLDPVRAVDSDTVCLFGYLLERRIGAGNAALKTSTLGGNDVRMHIGAEAMKELSLLPALAAALLASTGIDRDTAKTKAKDRTYRQTTFPAEIGSSGGFAMQEGLTLRNISLTFADGRIAIRGQGDKDAGCALAIARFSTDLSFQVQQQPRPHLEPLLSPNPPNVETSLEVDVWCQLLGVFGSLFFQPLIGLPNAIFGSFAAEAIGGAVLQMIVEALLPSLPIPGSGLPSGEGIRLEGVTITPEGLSIQGKIPGAAPALPERPDLRLEQARQEIDRRVLGTSTYTYPGGVACGPKDFTYTHVQVEEEFQIALATKLLARPLRTAWRVNGIALRNTEGELRLDVATTFGVPPGNGTSQMATVTVKYRMENDGRHGSGTRLVLRNIPTDGSYALIVSAKVQAQDGATLEAGCNIEVHGDFADFGDDYRDYVQHCFLAAARLRASTLPAEYFDILKRPVPDPRVRDVLPLVIAPILIAPQSTVLLGQSRFLYGQEVHRQALGAALTSFTAVK